MPPLPSPLTALHIKTEKCSSSRTKPTFLFLILILAPSSPDVLTMGLPLISCLSSLLSCSQCLSPVNTFIKFQASLLPLSHLLFVNVSESYSAEKSNFSLSHSRWPGVPVFTSNHLVKPVPQLLHRMQPRAHVSTSICTLCMVEHATYIVCFGF